MYITRYETHNMPHPLLPFIFHRRFEVTNRNKYPNWHENIELLQAIDGSGYAICGARQLPLNPDTLVIVNADTLHNIGTNSRLVYRCFIIDNSFFLSSGGLFGWIDVDIKVISTFTPVVLLLAAFKNAPLLKKEDFSRVVIFFITALLTYAVCATGLYLTWTPVTLPQIIGLQMRYFIPAFMGILMLFSWWAKGYAGTAKAENSTQPATGHTEKAMAKGECSTIWIGFVFAVSAVMLLFAAYYFPLKAIVFVA